MTPDEAAHERMAAAIREEMVRQHRENERQKCPAGSAFYEEAVAPSQIARAAFVAILADPPPAVVRAVLERGLDEISAAHDRRVTELLAANSAEAERRRAAEALAERMWPIVEEVAGASEMVSRYGGMLPVSADNCRATAALVREREEKEAKP